MDKNDFLKIPNATNDVPWERKGCPGSDCNKYEWGNQICNIAQLDGKRLKSFDWCMKAALDEEGYGFIGYIEERMFAEQWDYENNFSGYSLLWTLIGHIPEIHDNIKSFNDVILVEKISAMIVQWLGTNVGSGFIDRVRKVSKEQDELIGEAVKKLRHKKNLERKTVRAKILSKEEKEIRRKNRLMKRGLRKGGKKKKLFKRKR